MKRTPTFFAMAILLFCSSSALAATATLSVSGTITPGSCNIYFMKAHLDYGNTSINDLTGDFAAPAKDTALIVTCDNPRLLKIAITGHTGGNSEALGLVADGEVVGELAVIASNYKVNGEEGDLLLSEASTGGNPTPLTSGIGRSRADKNYLAFAKKGRAERSYIENASIQLNVQPLIDEEALKAGNLTFEGQMVAELIYE